MHAAAALGKTTLGIFGPTDPKHTDHIQETLHTLFIRFFIA